MLRSYLKLMSWRTAAKTQTRIIAAARSTTIRTFSTSLCLFQQENTKIEKLVEDISKLTLLETSQLVDQLKTKLNIQDVAPIAFNPSAVSATDAGAEEPAKKEAAEEKTSWTVRLDSFDAGSKAKVIKEVKAMLGLTLVEAKKTVEAAPKVLKENVLKEDADAVKSKLEGLGCKVTLE
ncbi:putative mitochondrial 54S ribosomal protein MNP1 [Schizosaccharomyces japonicus yFS275]|uniref:Ribosomal protein subunit L12 n=1 Tax=Schizosaccharomyces japonicus (strain yFS275 / FY16936) TaxID=402676 RepID=B6JZV9_SCHJY|nr:putative mitochondrial 54S ribosomal protein MNP1 [Schizosaccharomyces japonicus yFS275]EEB06109.1 ribosomal protein subunit L12 [Schizosaccharomyces japonicus yFS275]